ncbi:MAG: RNA polymerase sigma factor [Myxococcota bacterium]
MAAYAAGDDRPLGPLFRALAPRVLAFFRKTTDPALAEDLLQMTFMRLHAARHTYRPGARVRPWLFTIAARVRVDELRRRHLLPRPATDEEMDRLVAALGAPVPGEASEPSGRDRRVREAVDGLPASQRVVIQLHRFEGLSFGEIAQALGVSEGAARVRACRAYEALRQRLQPVIAEEGLP